MKIMWLLLFLVLIFGCAPTNIKSLEGVEIRGYEGEKLSSVADFRENSIESGF